MEDDCGVAAPGAKKPFQFTRSLTYGHHHQGHRPAAAKQQWRRHHDESRGARPQSMVLYTTSLRGVRRTFTDCSAARAILRGFRVAIDERDVSMDPSLGSGGSSRRCSPRAAAPSRSRAPPAAHRRPPRRRRGRGPPAE
ncbi:hypothetical protein PR202_gb21916 [Eleusine coracana subsp. coracana]|uniref:Glutaredoxin domain-containing protein n=1 Tax=Eleusine coracana subsp. coracana TaxID=191504 RepID=A0AAV5FCB8_ELECO|nr:hypothetical protein PR202_gb21916 [Eleusine coracana subsp. coracana]